jgi:spore maturation protein CgeB
LETPARASIPPLSGVLFAECAPQRSTVSLPRKRRILSISFTRPGTNPAFRTEAFRRLGQEVLLFDPQPYLPRSPLAARICHRFPVGPLIRRINRDLLREVRSQRPEVVWFEKPIFFYPDTIRAIRATGALTVCYNTDNPFGPRNDGCWYQFRKAFRLFDLHCLFREADVARYRDWGLNYVRMMFSFERAVQFPPPAAWSDADRPRQVSYIGAPYEERPAFLTSLAEEQQIPVVISGPASWKNHLSPERFSRLFAGGRLTGNDYREGIWKSKINLSFVTRLNEDDIAHKSVEIAACQGFLLALRTPGHQALFDEDREAVFFSSVEECADKCRFYLPRPGLREAIARRGCERAVRSGYDNDTQLRLVLDRLDGK